MTLEEAIVFAMTAAPGGGPDEAVQAWEPAARIALEEIESPYATSLVS
jgi:hypothetical protein